MNLILRHIALLSILLGLPCLAEDGDTRRHFKSLWQAAENYTAQGKFLQSDSTLNVLLADASLTSKQEDLTYMLLERNAYLSGDYQKLLDVRRQRFGDKWEESPYFITLASFPKERVTRTDDDVKVEYYRDLLKGHEEKGGLLRIPVTIGGKQEYFILDNGIAVFSAVSESFAKEHGINTFSVDGKVEGTTGTVNMSLGYADSLSIGSLKLYNLVFSIIPDQPQMDSVVKIDAILGGNFFRQVGDIVFHRDEKMIVFPYQQRKHNSNITINDIGQHFIKAEVFGFTNPFQIDLGATSTSLDYNFYKEHKALVRRRFKKATINLGGIGGVSEVDVYDVPELSLKMCGKEFKVNDTHIESQPKKGTNLGSGIIGNDIIDAFSKVTLNLKYMYLLIED